VRVVEAVWASRYGAGRVGDGSERGKERLVGWSTAGAAVGVEEEEQVSGTWRTPRTPYFTQRSLLVLLVH